jgi:branched-chain amino acid transport system ATP-binding protein
LANSINVEGIYAAYGAVRVLEDVTLKVAGGETVVLLGTNGNGKSTLMKSIMGIVRPSAGRIMAEIDGINHDLIGRSTEDIVDLGIAMVPEGRRLFQASRSKRTCCSGPSGRARERRSSAISTSASRRSRASPSGATSSPAA